MAVTKKSLVGPAKKFLSKNSHPSFDISRYLTVHKQAGWLFNPSKQLALMKLSFKNIF